MLYSLINCQTCPANYYCQKNVSFACPTNYVAPPGSSSISQGMICGNGTYQNPNNVYQCLPCQPRTYCPSQTITATTCPPYSYCPDSSTNSTQCPASTYSLAASGALSSCICVLLLVQNNGACLCSPGTHVVTVNQTIGSHQRYGHQVQPWRRSGANWFSNYALRGDYLWFQRLLFQLHRPE